MNTTANTGTMEKPPRKYVVVGVGEILWDLLPNGSHMGGAPANVAYHARALGAEARVISRVGSDDLGARILRNLRSWKVRTSGISIDPVRPTGTAVVRMLPDGQHQFTITEDVAWDFLPVDAHALSSLADADAVCFGTLAQRSPESRHAIREMIAGLSPGVLRVFDANLRENYYSDQVLHESLEIADVVKLSETELPTVMDLLGIGGSISSQIETVVERYGLQMLACTRGRHGSLLYDGQSRHDYAGESVEVTDTIGAGDSFTASLVLGTLAGWPLPRLNHVSNAVASHVCKCHGATPTLPPYLRHHFESPAASNVYEKEFAPQASNLGSRVQVKTNTSQ